MNIYSGLRYDLSLYAFSASCCHLVFAAKINYQMNVFAIPINSLCHRKKILKIFLLIFLFLKNKYYLSEGYTTGQGMKGD